MPPALFLSTRNKFIISRVQGLIHRGIRCRKGLELKGRVLHASRMSLAVDGIGKLGGWWGLGGNRLLDLSWAQKGRSLVVLLQGLFFAQLDLVPFARHPVYDSAYSSCKDYKTNAQKEEGHRKVPPESVRIIVEGRYGLLNSFSNSTALQPKG